ncbi:unnamed protein product [Ambrosiozyma monospora]|uniref:Unnamed protein product n=1 Tax=Ambrosiozyma monospora TaxID=43982 RepID=A0A9W6Z9B5_AMBMO|nr:unnamed protein product [Ambrosiozyma monospora]
MSIHVLFDDIFFKFFNKFPKNDYIDNENALVIKLLPKIVAYLTNLKQMISNNIKPLKYFGLIIPFNNGICWSLLWIQFPTSNSKYVTIYQVDPRTNHLNGLNYNLKYLTKLILCYLLDIGDVDDVTCNFHYVRPVMEDENLNDEDLVIYNTIKLLKGYENHGYNYDIFKHDLDQYDDILNYVKILKKNFNDLVDSDNLPKYTINKRVSDVSPTDIVALHLNLNAPDFDDSNSDLVAAASATSSTKSKSKLRLRIKSSQQEKMLAPPPTTTTSTTAATATASIPLKMQMMILHQINGKRIIQKPKYTPRDFD